MKTELHRIQLRTRPIAAVALATACCLAGLVHVRAQTTNFVTGANGLSDYIINGQLDPPFTFQRGVTYVFQLSNVSIHPFWIKSALGIGSTGRYDVGVTNNGATSGSVIFSVTTNAPDTLFYQCGNHSSMSGTLTIVNPPSPPTVRIVYINVGDLITIKSTGTNGWSVVPEFRCLDGTNWTPVGVFTNTFANGTNTTTFQRLEAICGPAGALIRVRNQQN
jgi:hypothetical protein